MRLGRAAYTNLSADTKVDKYTTVPLVPSLRHKMTNSGRSWMVQGNAGYQAPGTSRMILQMLFAALLVGYKRKEKDPKERLIGRIEMPCAAPRKT